MFASHSTHRARWAAVGAAVAVTLGAVGLGGLNIVSADVSSGDRPVFISINPCRLIDTRPGDINVGPRSSKLGAGETVAVAAHGTNGQCTGPSAIPTDAIGLSLNVTAVAATASTFLTFWGEGTNPGTSNLNPRPGAAPTPNAVSTPLSATGNFNIYNDAGEVNIIADVNGYYASHDHDDRYSTESESDERYVHATDTLLVSAQEFRSDDAAHNWVWVSGAAQHEVSGANSECIDAVVDLPEGVEVTATKLVYAAPVSLEIDVEVSGLIGVAGPVASQEEATQSVAAASATLPKPGIGVLGGYDLDLGVDSSNIDPSRFNYLASVCVSDRILLYGLELTLATDR